MSSHHVIREKQEPALLILSLKDFPSEFLGQLLEWSPTVLVSEAMYDHAESLGIKIDGIITNDPDFKTQEHTHIILTENNPLEDGMKYLVGEQYHAVNIVADKFALKDFAVYADDIDMVIFAEGKKIYPIRSGFSKWQAAGEQLVLPHSVPDIKYKGLYQLTDGVLETEKDGFYTISFPQEFIFISEIL